MSQHVYCVAPNSSKVTSRSFFLQGQSGGEFGGTSLRKPSCVGDHTRRRRFRLERQKSAMRVLSEAPRDKGSAILHIPCDGPGIHYHPLLYPLFSQEKKANILTSCHILYQRNDEMMLQHVHKNMPYTCS